MNVPLFTSWLDMLGSRPVSQSIEKTPWHALLELAARCSAKMLLPFRVEAPRYASTSELQRMHGRVMTF